MVDDHASWPKEQDDKISQSSSVQKKWQSVAKQTLFDHKQKGKDNEDGDAFLVSNLQAKKSKYSFSQFLKRFSIVKEEMQIAVVEQLPKITEKIKEVGAELDKRLEDLNLNSLVCSEETRKSIKELRTKLGAELKDFERQRKCLFKAIILDHSIWG